MAASRSDVHHGLPVNKNEEIANLIDLFSKNQYRAKEATPQMDLVERRCLDLFARDYKFSIIHNANGEVCGHYPRQIVFLEYESPEGERDGYESAMEIGKLQDLVNRSKLARCRGRFVCPVILYNGKHICRSSTLAGWGELYGRTGYNYIFSGRSDQTMAESQEVLEEDGPVRNGDSQLFDKVRGHDIKLLRYLSVSHICDLMVENKKVKFGLNVTSSEKADKAQRYADFTLLSVPYPGCEFFRDYKDQDYTAEGLVFNWNQDYVDAPLTIPDHLSRNMNIDWSQYQAWDLIEQTQNYLKLLLHIVNFDDENGLLVHCISGWDRTPLFVSLIRLSLWADGTVHANLQPAEILYLTIAYDWFLFGHMLPDRLSKGEEIFFFCFNFLKHIVSERFSAVRKPRRKNCHYKDSDFTMEDLCQLNTKDHGSVSSLNSDFSVCTEDGVSSSLTNDFVDRFTSSQSQVNNWRKGVASSPQMVVWNKLDNVDEHSSVSFSEAKSSSSSSSNQSEHVITHTGSSPLAVPGRRVTSDTARSGSSLSTEYGSWQIVSGCGSIHDNPHLPHPLASSTSSAVATESPMFHSFQEDRACRQISPLPSKRQTRLEAVREIFLAAYSSTVGLKSTMPSPSGTITGLLEHLARGVGLRGTNAVV